MTLPALPANTRPETFDELSAWLIDRVAYYLDCPASDIKPDVNLTQYGLDSVYALTLSGDIEDELEITVSVTLAWDYRTVAEIARVLEAKVAGRDVPARA